MSGAATPVSGQPSPRAHCAVLERFSKHRKWNTPISRELMANTDTREIGRAIANCALKIKAQVLLHPDKEPEANLKGAHLCNARFCPFCEARRTKALRARLYQGLGEFYKDYPKYRGVFLTLTVKNVPLDQLGDQLDQMNKAWNRMKQCSFFPTEFWFRRTEITVGVPMGYGSGLAAATGQATVPYTAHPHFHVLLLVRPSYFSRDYIKKSEWQKQWQMALRTDYPPVVDVRSAKSKKGAGLSPSEDAKSSVMEAAKYAAKATQLLELGPAITDLHWELRNRRLVALSNKLGAYVKAGDASQQELLDCDSKPLPEGVETLDVIGTWFEDVQEYVISDICEETPDL